MVYDIKLTKNNKEFKYPEIVSPELEVRAFRSYLDVRTLLIIKDNQEGKSYAVTGFKLKEIEPYTEPPSYAINCTEAQRLMDDLWVCGVRPTEGKGSAGSLKATENHLEDMKTLTYKLLDKVIEK